MENINFSIEEKSEIYTEIRSCPLCDARDSFSILRFDNFKFLTDSLSCSKTVDIDIHSCNQCETIFTNPVYTEIGFKNLFSEMAHSYGMSDGRPQEQVEYLKTIGVLKDIKSVLDLGCYRGDLLSNFSENLQRTGIDIDRPSIEIAKQRLPDAKFFCQDLEKFNTGKKYDLIVMLHVLEHLKNPLQVLKNILNSSHSKTKLLIEVPILENGFTNDINGFFSAQHLTHFSRASLQNFFKKIGWEILRIDEQVSYNGTRVIATPASKKEKFLPSIKNDMGILYSYLQHWYKVVESIDEKLSSIVKKEKYIVWGAGLHTEFLFNKTSFFRRNKKAKFLFFDSDPTKIGGTYRGVPIVSPFCEKKKISVDTPIIISSYSGSEDMKRECRKRGWSESSIISLYEYYRLY